jgi:hypothetical protein
MQLLQGSLVHSAQDAERVGESGFRIRNSWPAEPNQRRTVDLRLEGRKSDMWQQILDYLEKMDWAVVPAVIALVLLVVALIFTAETLRIQRTHNRLSVRPIAVITVGDYLDELVVHLQNKGTGPLIIKDLSFTDQSGRKEKSIVDFFGSDFGDVVWSTFVSDIDGWAILPGETRTLIKLVGDDTDKDFLLLRERVRKVLASLQVELQYRDIYESDMPKKVSKLDFFAR